MIAKDSELGSFIEEYQNFEEGMRSRVMGYMSALSEKDREYEALNGTK